MFLKNLMSLKRKYESFIQKVIISDSNTLTTNHVTVVITDEEYCDVVNIIVLHAVVDSDNAEVDAEHRATSKDREISNERRE